MELKMLSLFIGSIYDKNHLSPALDTMGGGNRQPLIAEEKEVPYNVTSATVYKKDSEFRIRKLTPKECWRLMGFSDQDFTKAQMIGLSNTQLYKQAGNSIVVNVLEEIFKNLFFN